MIESLGVFATMYAVMMLLATAYMMGKAISADETRLVDVPVLLSIALVLSVLWPMILRSVIVGNRWRAFDGGGAGDD